MAGNRPNNKRTKEEKDKVISEIAQYLYDNPTTVRAESIKWIMSEYTVNRQWAYSYRKLAYARVADLQDKDIESKRTLRVNALEKMFHQAGKDNDPKLQLAILQELNKVDNLYVHKVEQTDVKDIPMFDMSKPKKDDDIQLKKVD